jgi:hypothetical protein
MNDFQKSVSERFTYSGYSNHFASLYKFSGGLIYVLLGISAFLSAKFFEVWFSMAGENSLYFSVAISLGLALLIGALTEKTLIYWHYQKVFPALLGGLAVGCMALNIYADLNGAKEWGADFTGTPPEDSKTSEISGIYTPQLSAIDKEVNEIESKNFYWCGVHKQAHKCKSASFYIDPKRDGKHVAKIEELKGQKAQLLNTMNGMLSDANGNHQSRLTEYGSRLDRNSNSMRFGSIVCNAIFLVLSFWRLNYGVRFVSEADGVETGEQTAPVKEQRTASVKDKKSEAERAWEQLVKDNPELAHEILTREEAEQMGKQFPQH